MFRSKTFQALLFVILSFSLMEVAMQVRAVNRFGEARATYMIPDPVLGKVLLPNYKREGALGTISINEHGRRGESFTETPKEGSLRLVCMGSSVVFGGGTTISDRDVFPSVLERELRKMVPGKEIDVINAGCPGWTSVTLRLDFEGRLADYQPDIAVIYAVVNDIGRVMKGGAAPSGEESSLSVLSQLIPRYSVLYNAFRDRFKSLRPEVAGARFKSFPVEEGRSLFMKDYRELVDSVRAHGVIPILVTEPQAFRRDQPLSEQEKLFGGVSWGLGLSGFYQAQDTLNGVIRDISKNANVPLIDLAELMDGGEELFIDSIHFSREGHRIAAKILAEELTALGLLSKVEGGGD